MLELYEIMSMRSRVVLHARIVWGRGWPLEYIYPLIRLIEQAKALEPVTLRKGIMSMGPRVVLHAVHQLDGIVQCYRYG